LQVAEQAQLLAPRNAAIMDTVGWIKHLLGDHAGAIKLLEPAAKALPDRAEVQFHTAAAYAAAGRLNDAAAALKKAEAIDPKIKGRPEYQAIIEKIGK
jgi:tetratricopeptide (TPR) repeat protein